MCGIVGIASRDLAASLPPLPEMRDTMRHRGPDDAGSWFSEDGRVALAHRRLAVIDLSEGGRQPMEDSAGLLRIVYNGEIYNYRELRRRLERLGRRFRTASDTETILEAYREWGTDCLARMNGMFAFGLYDGRARRLFLARDRAGEKPLFYRHAGGRLWFASELKALLADPSFPREIDPVSLDFYLAYGYVPSGRCILAGVGKLPQGHAMTYDVDSDRSRVWAYWELPPPPEGPEPDPGELEEELEGLLYDSVRLRMTADVPVGILLSGGLDSSLVTAMAARVSPGAVKTFTVSFPGHGLLDEGPHARRIAEHFGTDHVELAAEPATVALLPLLARQFDEPIGDHSIVPTYLVSRLVRRHATVALGGDGGDELFGGYPHYPFIRKLERLRPFVPRGARRAASAAASRFLPPGTRGRNHVIGFAGGLADSLAHINLYFDARSRGRLLAPLRGGRALPATAPESYKAGLCAGYGSPLRQSTALDFRTTMVDGYLVKVDRASMLASLEVRAPFLDHRLVEFAFGRVPDSMRATAWERKVLLKRLGRRLLPPGFDLKRKQGFAMPLATWFRGEWGVYLRSVLEEADPGLFDKAAIRELVALQRRGYANEGRLFLLAFLELWRREFRVEAGGPCAIS